MKKNLVILTILGLVSLTSCKKENETENTTVATTEVAEVATAADFKVDPASSIIEWVGSKPAGKHTGTIALKDGSFAVTDGVVTGGDFTIDMTSITVTDLTGDEKARLEGHLKGTGEKEKEDHFFNTTAFPTGNFKITKVEGNTVTGILTLKDVANEVSFPATIGVNENEVKLESEPFTIDRTKWNVNYASQSVFDDLKDKFINDEIELVVKVKATK